MLLSHDNERPLSCQIRKDEKFAKMNNERFLQPLITRLLSLIGLQQTLAYVSTCKEYRKERKWFIEQHTIVITG